MIRGRHAPVDDCCFEWGIFTIASLFLGDRSRLCVQPTLDRWGPVLPGDVVHGLCVEGARKHRLFAGGQGHCSAHTVFLQTVNADCDNARKGYVQTTLNRIQEKYVYKLGFACCMVVLRWPRIYPYLSTRHNIDVAIT